MKCAKCGAELKEGCLYCSVCGHEAQMVNGYSVLEEDYLKALLTDEASKDTSSEETENQKKKAEGHHKKKKQTPWIVLGCVAAVVAVIAIGAIVYVRYQNNNSYDYQIEMAEKELVDLNYEKALSYYKNALTLSPNDINARAAMAEIYLARKEYDSAFDMYDRLAAYYEENDYNSVQHKRSARYEILLNYVRKYHKEKEDLFREVLTYDYYLRENAKSRPAFAGEYPVTKDAARAFYETEEETHEYLPDYGKYDRNQMRKMTHLEYFKLTDTYILFDYQNRNPLNQEARVCKIEKIKL